MEVDFNGRKETWKSSVKIKKCRYLEQSGCVGMCLNMCKVRMAETGFFSVGTVEESPYGSSLPSWHHVLLKRDSTDMSSGLQVPWHLADEWNFVAFGLLLDTGKRAFACQH